MEDLALEVRDVHDVEVDDADGPDAGRREVERRGRPEPAGADEQHAPVEQPRLPLEPNLRHEQVAAVPARLLAVSREPAGASQRGRRARHASVPPDMLRASA